MGSLAGNANAPVLITALGQKTPLTVDVALGKITIGGSVLHINIEAGYDTAADGQNGDAQIGAVTVFGSWSQSNLVAGIQNIVGTFGDANSTVIPFSRRDVFRRSPASRWELCIREEAAGATVAKLLIRPKKII